MGFRTPMRKALKEITRLQLQLQERTKDFEKLKNSIKNDPRHYKAIKQVQILETRLIYMQERNRMEKNELEEHLRTIIHSQEGSLAKKKNDFNNLQKRLEKYCLKLSQQEKEIKSLKESNEVHTIREANFKAENENLILQLQKRNEVQVLQKDNQLNNDIDRILKLEKEEYRTIVK